MCRGEMLGQQENMKREEKLSESKQLKLIRKDLAGQTSREK